MGARARQASNGARASKFNGAFRAILRGDVRGSGHHGAATEVTMTLTGEQLAQYGALGYAGPNPLLTAGQLAGLRAEMETLIDSLPPGQRPENMPSPHYDSAFIRELLLSDPFVDIAEQILGPDVALFTVYAISKKPGDGLPVRWHQDADYFPIEPVETFTLWLAVDDSTRANGCMQVLPGSHRPRRLRRHGVFQDDGSVLPQSLAHVDASGAVAVEVPAGHYTVHDAYVLHGSNPNRSARRRCAITVKYVPTYVHLNRDYRGPTGFDWHGLRLYLARGRPGNLTYAG